MEKFPSTFHIVKNFWHQLERGKALTFPQEMIPIMSLLTAPAVRRENTSKKQKKKFRSWIQTRLSCCDFRSGCASSALIRDRLRFLADPAADKSPLMSAHLPKAALIVAPLRDYKWKREMLGAPSPKQGEKGGKTHLPACCVQGQLVI